MAYHMVSDLAHLTADQRREVRAEYRHLRWHGCPRRAAKGAIIRLVRVLTLWGD